MSEEIPMMLIITSDATVTHADGSGDEVFSDSFEPDIDSSLFEDSLEKEQ